MQGWRNRSTWGRTYLGRRYKYKYKYKNKYANTVYLITTEKEHTEEGGQRVHIPDQDGHLRKTRIRNTQNTQIWSSAGHKNAQNRSGGKGWQGFRGLSLSCYCWVYLNLIYEYFTDNNKMGMKEKWRVIKNDFPFLNFLLKWILLCNLQHCFKMKRRKKYDLQVLNYLLKRILPFDCEIGFCVRRQIWDGRSFQIRWIGGSIEDLNQRGE